MSRAILTSSQYQNYRRIELIVGHRDLPGVKKECPCYEVNEE